MRKLLFAMSLLIAGNSIAQELPKNYAQLLEKVEPELIQWRRHFHQNPELSNREYNTGKYIADFLKTLPFERPAIVIADIQLPDISGVDLHRMLMKKNINPPIIFISGEASIQESIDAMKQGAIEFLVKPFEIDTLIAAVNNAIKIELKEINLNFLLKNLSPRELEVYNLLLQGLNNQELIDKLHLSLPTVKQYKSEVMRKLKVNSLSKLIELAR